MDNWMLPRLMPPSAASALLLPLELTTRNWQRVVLRAMTPDDVAPLGHFFSQLAPATRRMRFHGGVKVVSERLLERMTNWDQRRELALLAIADDGGVPVCIGEARYAVTEAMPDAREFALVVGDAWQGLGVGASMLDLLCRHARDHGVARLIGDVQPDNDAMIRLATRRGFGLRTHPEDPRLSLLSLVLAQARAQPPSWPLPALQLAAAG